MKIKRPHFNIITIALAIFALGFCSLSPASKKSTIQSSEIGKSIQIIGQCGLQMGNLAKMTCVIVDGESTNSKNDMGRFLVKIISVNEKNVTGNVVMHFEDKSGSVPSTTSALFELINNKEFKSANNAEIEKLKSGYVG